MSARAAADQYKPTLKDRLLLGVGGGAAVLLAALGVTSVVDVASAPEADAATTIYGNCYQYREWNGQLWRACWVDYSWYEEVFQGKRDGYHNRSPIVCVTGWGCTR